MLDHFDRECIRIKRATSNAKNTLVQLLSNWSSIVCQNRELLSRIGSNIVNAMAVKRTSPVKIRAIGTCDIDDMLLTEAYRYVR